MFIYIKIQKLLNLDTDINYNCYISRFDKRFA